MLRGTVGNSEKVLDRVEDKIYTHVFFLKNKENEDAKILPSKLQTGVFSRWSFSHIGLQY